MEPPPVPGTEDAAPVAADSPSSTAAKEQEVAPSPKVSAETVAASPGDSSRGSGDSSRSTPQGKAAKAISTWTSRVETRLASMSPRAEEKDSPLEEDALAFRGEVKKEAPVEASIVEAPASTAPLLVPTTAGASIAPLIAPATASYPPTPHPPQTPTPHEELPVASALVSTPDAPPAQPIDAWATALLETPGRGEQEHTAHPPSQRATTSPPAYEGQAYESGSLPHSFATRMHMGHARAPTASPNRVPGALQRGGNS